MPLSFSRVVTRAIGQAQAARVVRQTSSVVNSASPHAIPLIAPTRAHVRACRSAYTMSTTVRDFSSRSPIAEETRTRERRASVRTNVSVRSSSADFGLRHRKPSRSNTITTYQEPEHSSWQPGAEQGIDTSAGDEELPAHLANLIADCDIKIVDFSEEDVKQHEATNDTIAEFLDETRPVNLPCRWISVNGLSWDVIRILGNKFRIHQLAIEDLIHTHTRTKVDWYSDQVFIVLTLQKLVRLHQHRHSGQGCACPAMDDPDPNEKQVENPKGQGRWWSRSKARNDGVLPYYLDRDGDGKIDEFIPAHSGLDESSPIKPIRTLHRYESAQSPEHTAWMEQHSVLAKEELAVSVEQVAIFLLADNCVISFFEHSADDVEKPIIQRINSKQTILRKSVDASLLTQAIIDAIVDLSIPVRDAYNKARKDLQIDAMTSPDIRTSRALHIFGEEIDMLQNLFKPIVHLVNALRDHNSEPPDMISIPPSSDEYRAPAQPASRGRDGTAPRLMRNQSDFRRVALKRIETGSVSFSPLAHTYFGDVLDHCITMISALEQMDASAGNISTLIFNTVGAKTNKFMMILAVVTVFFAPLTFISGYFGMNFASGNGLDHPFAFFWIIAIPILVVFMLLVFATMLWDQLRDALSRRGITRRNWRRKRTMRRLMR